MKVYVSLLKAFSNWKTKWGRFFKRLETTGLTWSDYWPGMETAASFSMNDVRCIEPRIYKLSSCSLQCKEPRVDQIDTRFYLSVAERIRLNM